MKYETFNDYLRERHADQYCGLDDDMADDCDNWVSELDNEELIDFADLYAYELTKEKHE